MNLTKAIEIQDQSIKPYIHSFSVDEVNAFKLGLEAMIRERNNRINPGAYRDLPLPGETED